jgi:phosphoribosylformylglycinamidine cyclo-ligase
MSGLSYRDSGVDVAAAERFVAAIASMVRSTHSAAVVDHSSRFAGLIRPGTTSMSDPVLAATCDGVGTKVLLARTAEDFVGLGIDLVAMSVNDLLPLRARPLLFLDYLAAARLDPDRLAAAVRGVVDGCRTAGCALLGGETAELPGMYSEGQLEMVGFAVGVVDHGDLPDPGTMVPGDVLLGLPSTGLHANGFSLARRALLDHAGLDLASEPASLDRPLGDELLTPTAIYVDRVLELMGVVAVKAAAHVTGGGLAGRAGALLEDGLSLTIDPDSYTRPPILDLIRTGGGVGWADMATTFNMGLGFLAVASPDDAPTAEGLGWLRVGEITAGGGEVDLGYV